MKLCIVFVTLLTICDTVFGDIETDFQYGFQYTTWTFGQILEETAEDFENLDYLESSALLNTYSVKFDQGDYNVAVNYVADKVLDDDEFYKNLRIVIGLPLFNNWRWTISGSSGSFDWDVDNNGSVEEIQTDYRESKIGVIREGDVLDIVIGVSQYYLQRPSVIDGGSIGIVEIEAINVMYEQYSSTYAQPVSGGFTHFGFGLGRATISDSVMGDDVSSSLILELGGGYKYSLVDKDNFDVLLVVGVEFQGQIYTGFEGESGNGHIDHHWNVFANLQIFF